MKSQSWIFFFFNTPLAYLPAVAKATCRGITPGITGLTAIYDGVRGPVTRCYNYWEQSAGVQRTGSGFPKSLLFPLPKNPVLPQERCEPADWKTSKHPPSPQPMSCHSLLTSPSEKDTCQGHRGPPAVLWVMSRGICARVCTRQPLRPAAVTRVCPSKWHSHAKGDSPGPVLTCHLPSPSHPPTSKPKQNIPKEVKRFVRESAVEQRFRNSSAWPTSRGAKGFLPYPWLLNLFFLYSENLYEFLCLGK